MRIAHRCRRTAVALLAAAALQGCHDRAPVSLPGEARVEAVYVLRSLQGEALPRRPFPTNNFEVIADTVLLLRDGTARHRRTTRRVVDGAVSSGEAHLTWGQEGPLLVVYGPCVTVAPGPCPFQPTALRGLARDGEWLVEQSSEMRVPARYTRVQ